MERDLLLYVSEDRLRAHYPNAHKVSEGVKSISVDNISQLRTYPSRAVLLNTKVFGTPEEDNCSLTAIIEDLDKIDMLNENRTKVFVKIGLYSTAPESRQQTVEPRTEEMGLGPLRHMGEE